MERKVCPYLARPNDGGTLADSPSEANFCQKAASPAQIRRDYQSTFCLNEQHSVCPVFQAYRVSQLPAMAATPQARALQTRKKLKNTLFVAGVLLYILAIVGFSGSELASRMLSFSNQMSSAGIRMPIPIAGLSENGWQRPLTGSRSTDRQPNSAAQAQGAVDCALPQGWQVYTVQPDDSIFRISTLYGISQEALMQANCLSSYTRLTPGSTLFIPTLEPTATVTATATTPYSLHHSPALNSGGGDDAHSSIEPIRPTAVAPTPVTPLPVPPVQDPVIVPNNPESAKEDKPANPPKSEDKKDKDDKSKDDQDQGKKEDKDKDKDDGKKDDKDNGKDDGKKDDKDNGKDDGKKDDKDKDKDDGKKDDKDKGKDDEKKDDKDNGKDDGKKDDKGKKGD